jgi:hypothetical protein
MSDDEARARLLRDVAGSAIRDPHAGAIPYTRPPTEDAGTRNVVSLGLASGSSNRLSRPSLTPFDGRRLSG